MLLSLSATFRGRLAASSLHVSASEWYNRPKLVHGPVKFSACSISHFAMNIITAKTFSTIKVNSAKCHNFSNPPKYLPAKISGHTVCTKLPLPCYHAFDYEHGEPGSLIEAQRFLIVSWKQHEETRSLFGKAACHGGNTSCVVWKHLADGVKVVDLQLES